METKTSYRPRRFRFFRTPAPITTLPFDITFNLMLHITDLESLFRFSLTSPNPMMILERCTCQIVSAVVDNEYGEIERDHESARPRFRQIILAIMAARNEDSLRALDDPDYIDDFCKRHFSSSGRGYLPFPFYQPLARLRDMVKLTQSINYYWDHLRRTEPWLLFEDFRCESDLDSHYSHAKYSAYRGYLLYQLCTDLCSKRYRNPQFPLFAHVFGHRRDIVGHRSRQRGRPSFRNPVIADTMPVEYDAEMEMAPVKYGERLCSRSSIEPSPAHQLISQLSQRDGHRLLSTYIQLSTLHLWTPFPGHETHRIVQAAQLSRIEKGGGISDTAIEALDEAIEHAHRISAAENDDPPYPLYGDDSDGVPLPEIDIVPEAVVQDQDHGVHYGYRTLNPPNPDAEKYVRVPIKLTREIARFVDAYRVAFARAELGIAVAMDALPTFFATAGRFSVSLKADGTHLSTYDCRSNKPLYYDAETFRLCRERECPVCGFDERKLCLCIRESLIEGLF